jgi:hypothetical protein
MSPEEIDALTLAVYRRRLNETNYAGPDIEPADRQVRDDGDDGKKQRARAANWRGIVLATLVEAGLHVPPPSHLTKEARKARGDALIARAARTLSEGE